MMDKKEHKNLTLTTGILTLTVTVARILLMRFYIDPESGFYTENHIAVVLVDVLISLCTTVLFASQFFIYTRATAEPGEKSVRVHEHADSLAQGTQTLAFSSSLIAFLMVASAVLTLYDAAADIGRFPAGDYVRIALERISANKLSVMMFAGSVLSALYYFKTAALNPERDKPAEPSGRKTAVYHILSFGPSIWVFARVFKCFFDMNTPMNSPGRIYETVSLIALSLFILAETRMLIGDTRTAPFFTYSYIAVLTVSSSSIVNLVLSSLWIYEPSSPAIIYAIESSFIIYIGARVYSQIRYAGVYFKK